MSDQPTNVLGQLAWNKVPVYRGFIPKLFKLTQEAGMLWCGGYVRWMCSPRREPVPSGDLDIFAVEAGNEEKFVKVLAELGWEVHRTTSNAYTMKRRDDLPYLTWPKIQIIRAFQSGRTLTYGSLENILTNFDFTVIRIGLLDAEKALADPSFLDDETHHRLRWRNIHCPISAVLRYSKYSKKGYYAPPGEVLRLFHDWDDQGDDYKVRLNDLFLRSAAGDMSEKEVNELEELLRID